MTDREFIKKIRKELIDCYQFLDDECQKAFDTGELLGMVKIYLEMQEEKEEEEKDERNND